MPEWFPTAAVSILVALIALTGTLLTWQLTRQAAIRKREAVLQRRIVRLTNYARAMQESCEKSGIDYEPWPDNLYDE